MNSVCHLQSIVRQKIEALGLDRVENFVLLAIGLATFFAGLGFWFGGLLGRWQMMVAMIFTMGLAAMSSVKMLLRFLAICAVCFFACAYTFSYCGIDASVYHVPVQRLLNEGWNPIFQSSVEDVRRLTNDGCMAYHAAFLPRFVALVGALIAKISGLFVADTFVHYFSIYLVFAAGFRFAKLQWCCETCAAGIFGAIVALPSQIGTIMCSEIDYSLYSCLATATLSILNWERTYRRGELFLVFSCLSFAMLMKFTGLVVGAIILGIFAFRHRHEKWLLPSITLLVAFCVIVGAAPYITTWVRYGSPFYPTHSFDSSVRLVDITDDFTSNADGASMGYFARIVYAWFSTKLACLGCAWWQGKDTFNPEFYVPVGVDGLKTWFRVLMWLAVGALAFSKKNRVTVLCLIVFALMNIAPLKYIGFGRYFMLIWLIPPLAMYNIVYNPIRQVERLMKYVKLGVYAVLCGLAMLVAVKTFWLWLRAVGLEGARQIVFQEAVDKGVKTFLPDKPMRGFGVNERYECAKKSRNRDLKKSGKAACDVPFDTWVYMPVGFSISPYDLARDFPKCDTPKQFREFAYSKVVMRLPKVLREQ